MALDIVTPTNAVVAGNGHLATRRAAKVKTVANVRPGRLAEYDTDDDHFKAASAGVIHGAFGWVDKNLTNPDWDKTANPVAEDEFQLVKGKGLLVRASLASGENVKRGDLLIAAANGEVKKGANLTIAAGATAVTSSAANGAIVAGSLPPGGRVVGEAAHDVDASAAAKDIVVESWI